MSSSSPRRVRKHADGQDRRRSGGALTPGSFESRGDDLVSSFSSASSHSSGSVSVGASSSSTSAVSVDIEHLLSVSFSKFKSRDKLVQHFQELHAQLDTFPREGQRTPSTKSLAKQLLEPRIFSHSDELVRAWVAFHCVHAVRLNPNRKVYNKAQTAKVFDRLNQEVRNNVNMQDHELFSVRFRMIETIEKTEVYVELFDTLCEQDIQGDHLEDDNNDDDDDDDDRTLLEEEGDNKHRKKKKKKKKRKKKKKNRHSMGKKATDYIVDFADALLTSITHQHPDSYENLIEQLLVNVFDEMADGNTLVQEMLDVVLRHLIMELREDGSGEGGGGAAGYSLILKGGDGTLERTKAEPRSVKIVQVLVADLYDSCATSIIAFVNGVLAGTDTSNSDLAAHVHSLVYELWRIQCMAEDMDFMMTIIPRISEQLESPDMATRLKAVACLGKVFTAGHDTLIKSHTTSFRVLMRRFCDSQAPVREELCRVISRLLIKLSISRQAQHEDTIAICADRLVKLLNDKDQTVRKTAVTVVGKMAYDQGVMPLLPENLVKTLVGRCMDKDPDVNHTASVSIAKTFREHMVQNWPDDWDATLGSTSFYAHLSKEITHKLAGVPGALVDFYNNSLGLGKGIAGPASSSSSSLTKGLSASSLVWEDNKNKAIIRAGFISRVFDETLVTRKGSLQKRAQMLVAIFNQFSPTQRTAFGRILRDRGHMAKTLNGLMDEALERGSTLKLSAGASSSSSSSGSSGGSGKKEKGRVTFASVSASQIKLKNDLIKLVGETVAENVTAALISSHRDRNIYKSVKVLCDPTCLVRRLSDKRKRLLSQLKVAQGDTSAAALEQCGQSLNAVLQTISLGGVVSCTQDSIVEIIAIARQCAEEGDMGKALATTELLSHITDMSQSYAYYSFDQITEYFMELSDPDAMADDGVDDDYASEDDDDRASLGRSRVGQHQRRSEPTRSERDEILLLILGIFSRALTRKVWGNSHANQNAPAKQAKILRTKDVRKRLMRLCLDGDCIALAEAAACAYGGMLLGTKSSSRDWQKAIQEVRDGLNVGGNLTMAPAGRKKTNSKSGPVDFQSGSFPIAAAAALPVLLEMAPSSGSTITEADNLFLDTCKEIQENALTQLTAETTSLSRIGKKSTKPEESGSDDDDDDVEDSSSDDEEDDSNDEDEDDKEEGNGLQGEMQSRPSGEHAHVCVMLLLRALRVRFKRRYGKNSISALHQDEARRILGRVYDILEDESMPVRAREGCMEAIFTFASGVTQSVCDVLTPRAYYAIGHYMLSRHIESSDRLSILSRVRKLCMQPDEHRRAHFGTLGNSMEFASLGVLCGSSLCNGSDCKSAEEEFEALIGFLRRRMIYFVRKHSQSSEKRRRKVTRKLLPERILQFGIAMIAHFSPGVETEGAAFDDKQRMVNFLLKPFLNESNNNYALMVNMAQQIRSGHNVSDLHLSGESSNNHALVAEMCKKSYISYRNKTKSMSFDAAELPPAVHIDKHWFRKVAVGNSSFAPSRYLAKGWEPKTPGRRRASTGVGISPIRAAGVSPISRKRKSNFLSGEKNEGKKKSKVIEDGKSKRQSNAKSFLQAKGKSEGDDDLPTKNEKEVEEDDLAIYEDAAADYEEDNDNDDDVDMLNDEEDNDASRKQASKTSAQKHEEPAPKENTVNASAPSEAAPSNPPRRRRRRRRGNY